MPNSKRTNRLIALLALILASAWSWAQTSASSDSSKTEEETPSYGPIFKPTIGLGVGNLAFFGDLYTKHFQKPGTSRLGYELHLSQPLNDYLHLNFYVMFGQLGANERTALRNENFQSTIRMGGVQLMYDFSNIIKNKHAVRPYILTGVEGFEFLSKTDLYDKNGNKYYYWSDGSIKNMAEGSPGSQNAVNLVRDYTYDSDVRELNRDGFGKYQERSWAIPVGIGFSMKVGERVNFRFGGTMHFTFTDYIDGITDKSVGTRKGNSANDKFMMMSASIHYDLIYNKKDRMMDTLSNDHFEGADWLAIDNGDEDADGVKDWDDKCHGTPAGVAVDANGCPLDDDKDLIPQYRDEEPATAAGMIANGKGVGITDTMAQQWYNSFYDSLGTMDPNARIVYLDSAKKKIVNPNAQPKEFTVELARYKGGVPSDEMAFLLSIGDVQSFNLGDEIVVYAAGSYNDIRMAVKRRDEFHEEGLKSAKLGYFKGDTYYALSDDEAAKEIAEAEKKNVTPVSTSPAMDKNAVVYRVQLGAYKAKLPAGVFKDVGDVIVLQTEDGYYRYCSGAYKTLNDAAFHRAELVLEGYGDAFVTAYKGGKRIRMSEAGATYEKEEEAKKETIDEKATTSSSFNTDAVMFRIQIGTLKQANDVAFEERVAKLKDVIKQPTSSGLMRFMVGEFKNYNDAVKYKNKLAADGYPEAFVIATFKGEVISIQEALELLK